MSGGGSQTVYQQPTQQELDAVNAANQQKAAALTKLNQQIFAESKGLRGMGGLYDWAGPTPSLAAPMTAANRASTARPGAPPAPLQAPAAPSGTEVGQGSHPGPSPVSPQYLQRVRSQFWQAAGGRPSIYNVPGGR